MTHPFVLRFVLRCNFSLCLLGVHVALHSFGINHTLFPSFTYTFVWLFVTDHNLCDFMVVPSLGSTLVWVAYFVLIIHLLLLFISWALHPNVVFFINKFVCVCVCVCKGATSIGTSPMFF